jgi:hypothetical protein
MIEGQVGVMSNLIKRSICQLQNIYHANDFSSLAHDWEIQIMAIFRTVSIDREQDYSLLAMHFS